MSVSASTAFLVAPSAAPLAQLRGQRAQAPVEQQQAPAPASGASGSSAALGCLAMAAGAALVGQVRGGAGRRTQRAARCAGFKLPGVESEEEKAARLEAEEEAAEAQRYAEFCAARDALNLPLAVPFMGQPAYREFMFNVPGDNGFDPAGLVQLPKDFDYQRRAELTHGRFAMLAAVGWPLAELYHPSLAKDWGMQNGLAAGGRAPSILNGGFVLFDADGFPTLTSFFFLAVVAMAAAIENKYEEAFDPLKLKNFVPPGLAKLLPEGREWMAEAEIKHGRLAMVAITAYVVEEVASRAPVVVDTPYLFSSTF